MTVFDGRMAMRAFDSNAGGDHALADGNDTNTMRRWFQAGAVAAGVGTAALFAPALPIALADDTSTTADASDAESPDGSAASSDADRALSTASGTKSPFTHRARRPVATFSAQGIVTTVTPRTRLDDVDKLPSQIRSALTRRSTNIGAATPSRPHWEDRQRDEGLPAVSRSRATPGGAVRQPSHPAHTVKTREFDAESLSTAPTAREPAPFEAAASKASAVSRFLARRPTTEQVTPAATANDPNRLAANSDAKPYPPAVTATVTVRAIVTDILNWTRPGTPTPDVPLPTTPLNDLVAGAWIAVRRAHYTFFNSVPTATPEVIGRNTDTGEIRGSVGAKDADGDKLTYGIVTDVKNGTLELHGDGTYTYTPNAALAHSGGVDSVTFSIDDAAANPWHVHGPRGLLTPERPTTVTVEIVVPKITNQAPVAPTAVDGPDPDVDGTVTGTIGATDANKDPLTYTVTSAPKNGTVTLAGNTYVYKPTPDARHAAAADDAKPEDKVDTFAITTADGYGGTVVTTVVVDIKPTNSAPTVTTPIAVTTTPTTYQRILITPGGSVSVFVTNGDVVIAPTVTDDDDDQVTVTATIRDPKWGTVSTTTDGTIIYTPSKDARTSVAAGPATPTNPIPRTELVTLTFDDGHGGVTTEEVTINVNNYLAWSAEGSLTLQQSPIDVSGLSETQPELKIGGLSQFVGDSDLKDTSLVYRDGHVFFRTTAGVEYDLGPASSFNQVAITKPVEADQKPVVTTYLNSQLQTLVVIPLEDWV
ncbi:MAG TPA: Ig-like domain-containing protein [Mycobacterium sp.]|nr:Ig-like domain-containing protein [Mycobacterium sp.]